MCIFFLLRGAMVLENNVDKDNEFKNPAYNMYSHEN